MILVDILIGRLIHELEELGRTRKNCRIAGNKISKMIMMDLKRRDESKDMM